MGGAVIAGQYLGDNKIDEARNASNQLMWFSALSSTLFMLIVLIARSFLIGILFGQIEVDVWTNADIYLLIVALSIPFIAIYNAGAAIVRTTNDASLYVMS